MTPSSFAVSNPRRVSVLAGVFTLFLSGGLMIVAACGGDDGDNKGQASSASSSGGGADASSSTSSSGAGSTSGVFNNPDVDQPDVKAPVCFSQKADAIEEKRPVDIIFAIDNSDSMASEIAEVENQINANFVNIIGQSGLDYRVIMLANHGAHMENFDASDPLQRICIKEPLSATNCNPIPPKPAETARFIHHNIVVNSNDAWCQILSSFSGPDKDGSHLQGWAPFLRQNAFKTFVVITDDRVNTECNPFGAPQPLKFDDKTNDPQSGENVAAAFDSTLLALSPAQFGAANRRNYVWHSIIGVAPFDSQDLTKPYPPGAAINVNTCGPTAVAPATGYQGLSKLTGGLRYPTCGLNYTTIFKAMADAVIKNSVVACDYTLPKQGDGGKIDPATASVEYTKGPNKTEFTQVPGLTQCAPDKFYIEGERVKLCPDTCALVQKDENADVKILFGCEPKNPSGTN